MGQKKVGNPCHKYYQNFIDVWGWCSTNNITTISDGCSLLHGELDWWVNEVERNSQTGSRGKDNPAVNKTKSEKQKQFT